MSAPRTKRQFAGAASDPAQRQITSFFTSGTPSQNLDSSPVTSRKPTSDHTGPSLPASVQANLLSVGMRVRKSVPEGYKTGSYSAFGLWDDRNSPAIHANPATAMGEGRSRANAISTPRELLPFCGIHKVGGLGTQPETTSSQSTPTTYLPALKINGSPIDDTMDNDDVPGLTSSQDSIDSTGSILSSPVRTRKRSYTDNDETPSTPGRLNLDGNLDIWRDRFDGEISPRTVTPAGWGTGIGRVMAVPRKTRLRGRKAGASSSGREDVMVVVEDAESGNDDFGEADFLVGTTDLSYGDGAGDWEVEMSGV